MTREIRILLVEDNPSDVRYICEMLRDSSCEHFLLDSVATLGGALTQIRECRYDVILLDLTLPDSNGIDTLFKISTAALETAVIIMTSIDDETLGIEAVKLGAQDYLPKELVNSRLFIRSIRYAIERHSAETALRQRQSEYRSLIDDVFDTSSVSVLILDQDFRIAWCNEVTEDYFGIAREQLLGSDMRLYIESHLKHILAVPEDYASRLFKAYDEGSFKDQFECHVMQGESRQARWLQYWSQPIQNGIYEGGRIEQYADVTAQKNLEYTERRQREFVEALNDISTYLTVSLDLKELLRRILENLDRVIPHTVASITIIEEEHYRIVQYYNDVSGHSRVISEEKREQLDYELYARMMYQTGRPLVIHDLQDVPQIQETARLTNVNSYVGAPIQLDDHILGFINLLSAQAGFFNDQHAANLVVFAKLVAIAIQNARLFEQSQQLAAFEERQRLARELHDSVSQTLFTCRTMSETALRGWERDPQYVYSLMNDVNHMTATALSEMRVLLLELHPTSLVRISLKALLDQFLQPIMERQKFELTLKIDDFPPLPPEVQIVCYRIIQEALNNIEKHAQAKRVMVRVKDDQDTLLIEIEDDGRGFEAESLKATSMGLRIMRERAASIGASIDISSKPGCGTYIRVIWNNNQA